MNGRLSGAVKAGLLSGLLFALDLSLLFIVTTIAPLAGFSQPQAYFGCLGILMMFIPGLLAVELTRDFNKTLKDDLIVSSISGTIGGLFAAVGFSLPLLGSPIFPVVAASIFMIAVIMSLLAGGVYGARIRSKKLT